MKRVVSLILALALAFCFTVIPVVAAGEPTATVSAVLNGETPNAGEKFGVSIVLSDVSSKLFVSGGIEFEWPVEVASLCRYNNEKLVTQDSSSIDSTGYGKVTGNPISNIYNAFDADEGEGQYISVAGYNLTDGKGYCDIYISQDAPDQSFVAVEDTLTMFNLSFVLNEGYTYDDFYFTITASKVKMSEDTTISSTIANGAIKAVNIRKAVSVGPIVVGDTTYNVVSGNLITKGYDEFTSATGAVLPWEVVENPEYTVSGGPSIHGTGDLKGGSDGNTMRTFFPIEGGKTYYVTNTVYNNTGAVTTSHSTTGMRGIIATGDPVFGTFEGLTMYSHVDYGGVSSWSAESDHKGTNYVGTPAGRDDGSYEMGLSTVGYIINAPAEATNIMISYGAWSKSEIYYGDFAIYEVEVSEVKEKATVTFEYKAGDEVVKTTEVEGYVGETAEVGAVKFVKDRKVYTAEAASAEVVSGGTTVAVTATAVENVVFAEKTESFNITTNSVYPYPTGRVVELEGTDVIYSASWNDVRYGEVYLPLTVGEGEGVNSAVLTLTPADIMDGQANTFVIYAADPATYGTANDLDALEVVGEGTFEAVGAAKDITLDLTQYFNNYPEAEGILLLYKVTGGLMAAYGASFEEAPYLTYEIGEAAEPIQPATTPSDEPSDTPSGEPTKPSEEPTTPSDEPTKPSEEPTTPSEEPTTPSEEPTTPSEEPTTPSEEPTTPSEEPTTPSEEPTTPSEEPTIPEGALVAAAGQNEAGIFDLPEVITAKGTVSFTVVPVEGANNDTVVAISDSAQMTPGNYFGNSSVFFLFTGGSIKVRVGSDNVEIAKYTGGTAYEFALNVDVEAKSADYVITVGGEEVVSGTTAFRNANVTALDAIVLANNTGAADALYVTGLDAAADTEPVPPLPFVDNGTNVAGNTATAVFKADASYAGKMLTVVFSFFRNDRPYVATATQVYADENGEISISTAREDDTTLVAVSVLEGVSTVEALTADDLGTPVGSWRN